MCLGLYDNLFYFWKRRKLQSTIGHLNHKPSKFEPAQIKVEYNSLNTQVSPSVGLAEDSLRLPPTKPSRLPHAEFRTSWISYVRRLPHYVIVIRISVILSQAGHNYSFIVTTDRDVISTVCAKCEIQSTLFLMLDINVFCDLIYKNNS